jgi:hypothetical protein
MNYDPVTGRSDIGRTLEAPKTNEDVRREYAARSGMPEPSQDVQELAKRLQAEADSAIAAAMQQLIVSDEPEVFIQPKLSSDRQLTPADTVLMNEAKALGNQLLDLKHRIMARATEQYRVGKPADQARLHAAQPERWADLGETHIQQGVMFLVRAVAQPTGV